MKRDADFYMNQMSPTISKTLTHEQREEFVRILTMVVPDHTQCLVRINAPFWFIRRFFISFYMGVDRRLRPREIDMPLVSRVVGALIQIFIALLVIVILFYFFYYLKCIFDINLFPDKHLKDFVPL